MTVNDFLRDLVYVVITVLVPVLLPKVLVFLNSKIDEVQKNAAIADNEIVNKYIDNVQTVLVTAVTSVSQTYVDSLKRAGAFTKEAQIEAKNKAIELAKTLITDEAANAITSTYGDFDAYLDAAIETLVNQLKK